MAIFCPSCLAATTDGARLCDSCSAPARIGDRYVITRTDVDKSGEDQVDEAAPQYEGLDRRTGKPVTLRIAPLGAEERLERETVVLRGLVSAPVPRVLDVIGVAGVGTALVLSRSSLAPLSRQLRSGLRIDDGAARRLLRAILLGLKQLHRLSPPVFHRNIQVNSVLWDGRDQVELVDFARATDVVEDLTNDPVLARPGYTPPFTATPAQVDIFAAAVTVIHVLARRSPTALPHHANGCLDFREAVVVDDDLELLLERWVSPPTRQSPQTVEDALEQLETCGKPVRAGGAAGPGRRAPALVASVVAVALAVTGAVAAIVGSASSGKQAGDASTLSQVGRDGRAAAEQIERITAAARAASEAGRRALQEQGDPAAISADPALQAEADDPTPNAPRPRQPGEPSTEGREGGKPTRNANKPARSKPPRAAQPPKAPSPVRALRSALMARKAELAACDDAAVDRHRLRVHVKVGGEVDRVTRVGRVRGPSAGCVEQIVRSARIDAKALLGDVDVEVWIWTRPEFKVAVY